MNTCLCCSGKLLNHIRHNSTYWFCPHCRAEMPVLAMVNEVLPHDIKTLATRNQFIEPKPLTAK